MRIERQCDRERLEGRAWLKGIGQDPIPQLFAGEYRAVIRIVGRQIGQRQYLAGVRIDDDDATRLGLVFFDRFLELGEGNILDLAVNRQCQVLTIMRFAHGFDIFDDASQAVLDHATAARGTGQRLLRTEFHTVLTRVFDVGETDHVRHHFPFRVKALVFLAGIDARNAQLEDFVSGILFDLPLEINKAAVRVQLLAQFGVTHLQQARQRMQLFLGSFLHIVRDRPDCLDRDRRCQHLAIAISNLATCRGQLQRTRIARCALLLQEVSRHALQEQGAPGQCQKCNEQDKQHQPRTPRRHLDLQHRARRKGDATRGGDASGGVGCAWWHARHFAPTVRYWVRCGVSATMFRSRLATSSIRAFVPSVD